MLLVKGTIGVVPEAERDLGYYSYFLVPKKYGGQNIKVLLTLDSEDCILSLDLQDTYFHMLILQSRKYLHFCWDQGIFSSPFCRGYMYICTSMTDYSRLARLS